VNLYETENDLIRLPATKIALVLVLAKIKKIYKRENLGENI